MIKRDEKERTEHFKFFKEFYTQNAKNKTDCTVYYIDFNLGQLKAKRNKNVAYVRPLGAFK